MTGKSESYIVSVIIPVYNSEKFLQEAIESVLSQTLEKVEIILVNDGSTDSSLEICEKYDASSPHIKLVSQGNSGVSRARNAGRSIAQGKYVFLMDSDDTLDTQFLESSVAVAEKNSSDVVILGDNYCKRTVNAAAMPTCALLIRNSFLKNHEDVKYPANVQPGEDGIFSNQLFALTDRISLNPSGVYHYRTHENQNHTKIMDKVSLVVQQIPEWLRIQEHFYRENKLLSSKALLLAKFVEHEPFEFRYLAMPLADQDKEFLHKIIKQFMEATVIPHLTSQQFRKLTRPFREFIRSEDYRKFDEFYENYLSSEERKKRLKLFLIRFVPVRSLRRRWRAKINEIIY